MLHVFIYTYITIYIFLEMSWHNHKSGTLTWFYPFCKKIKHIASVKSILQCQGHFTGPHNVGDLLSVTFLHSLLY